MRSRVEKGGVLVWTLSIAKSQALEIVFSAHAGAVEKLLGEGDSVSWGGARTKGEVHKWKLTKNMFLHSDLLTSLISSLTQLFITIRKLALRGNGVKRWSEINQSNYNIHKFNWRQTLPKYLRTFLNEFEFIMFFVNGPIIFMYYAESELSISRPSRPSRPSRHWIPSRP